MKFAINVNDKFRAITGWLSCSYESPRVALHHDGRLISEVVPNIYRKDVLDAGLHSTGYCGFLFSAEDLDLKIGNVYEITLHAERGAVNRFVLYGNEGEIRQRFIDLELLPRDDISFLKPSTAEIKNEHPDVFAYKTLLIRLRRGKRGRGARGKFVGYDYPHKESDWVLFRSLTSNYLCFWLRFLDARYLWSVIDTIADYGSYEERLASLSVINYMAGERFSQTRRCLFKQSPLEPKVNVHQLYYWGGMKTNCLAADDALDIWLTRNIEILGRYPVVRDIFFELLCRASDTPESELGMNIKYSEYFANVFELYRKSKFYR